jgi:SAM-dependent methyltransferase
MSEHDPAADPAADDSTAHWQRTYAERHPPQWSWTEERPTVSLELIAEAALPPDAAILDVGGGASRLAVELLAAEYRDLTVADISGAALARARADLGEAAARVAWVEADLRDHDFGRGFDLWHDRAVFHFMVEAEDRDAYLRTLRRSLKAGGSVVIATFGPQGPTRCSGLPVCRYDAERLAAALGPDFALRSQRLHDHRTPAGSVQQFLYARFER